MSLCLQCQRPIDADKRKHAKYCSKHCRSKHYGERIGIIGTGLAPATTGALAELLISADLLKRGYEVFRALSPSCSCDLMVLKDGKTIRVEVKTAYRNKISGNIMRSPVKPGAFDLVAMVIGGIEILYTPELERL